MPSSLVQDTVACNFFLDDDLGAPSVTVDLLHKLDRGGYEVNVTVELACSGDGDGFSFNARVNPRGKSTWVDMSRGEVKRCSGLDRRAAEELVSGLDRCIAAAGACFGVALK